MFWLMCCSITALMVMTPVSWHRWGCSAVDAVQWMQQYPPWPVVFPGRNEWLKSYVRFIQWPLSTVPCPG